MTWEECQFINTGNSSPCHLLAPDRIFLILGASPRVSTAMIELLWSNDTNSIKATCGQGGAWITEIDGRFGCRDITQCTEIEPCFQVTAILNSIGFADYVIP